MSNRKKADKLKEYNNSSGAERKQALETGEVWIKPTMCMEMKSKYHRNSSKREVRKMRDECEY